MDTSHLPDNEIEEITWQDDENRATLFLRSVFVLLSGALILGALMETTTHGIFAQLLVVVGLLIIFPVLIIWLFFGQGLRPVEWLTDQKYNAWNYGINFQEWKTHFRWLIPLLIFGIVEVFICKQLFLSNYSPVNFGEWLRAILIIWLLGIPLVWFIWGYLWFGCAQGFGAIAATALVIGFVSCMFLQTINFSEIPYVFAGFIPLVLLCSYICWKLKSWIPILYGVILFAPIASLILMY